MTTIDPDNLTDELLERMAAEADAGLSAPAPDGGDPANEETGDSEKTKGIGGPSQDAEKMDVDGSKADDKPPQAEAGKSEQQKETEKPSAYEEAKRSAKDREAKAWQKIEAEKAEIAKAKAEIEAERAKLSERAPGNVATSEQVFRDPQGYSVEDYKEAAKRFEDEGELDLANLARSKAKALQEESARAVAQQQAEGFKRQWIDEINASVAEDKAVGEPGSPVSEAIIGALNEMPFLRGVQGGFRAAHAIAKLKLQAAQVSAMESELSRLREENKRLTEATSIAGGGPSKAAAPKRFEDMSPDEQEKELERLAAEADGAL